MGMEGWIARWYATNTGKNLDDVQALAARIAARLPAGAQVLEVAPGPGYLAIELAKTKGLRVTGLDISRTFVDMAQGNARRQGAQVDFRHGDASAMPFADNSFQFVACRAAFKNFSRPVEALAEMRRVLAPGGTALVIDLRRDASWRSIREEVDHMGMGAASALFTKCAFRFMLLKRAYTRDEFQAMIHQAGFADYDIRDARLGFEIWLMKTQAAPDAESARII
jgi:ubiquinone/menaquinone biosynthesis C-methylase UbiE